MAEYISAPVETDPDELKLEVFDYLRTQIPGWEPRDGQLDVWMIEAFSEIAAQLGETATFVVRAIFRWYGANLLGITPVDAVPATGVSTWTAVDAAGYTIPVGTTIAVPAGESVIGFQTTAAATIPASATTVTGVPIVALETGEQTSQLSGPAQLVDPLTYITSVVVPTATPTSGGSEAETEDEYFDRLAAELQLLSPRAIRASDFAVLAQRVPAVDRALTLDNYLDGHAEPVPGAVTIVPIKADGQGITDPETLDALRVQLGGDDRLLNLQVAFTIPTTNVISVTFSITPWDGRDGDQVLAAAVAALQDYLSPANWGQPATTRLRTWINEPVVRRLEVAQVLNAVDGVRYVDALSLNGSATADFPMIGKAPLPSAGMITGSITAA